MRFNFSFSQALDISGLFFMEKYVYHSQFISKFFFGLHNSFLLLNYNNSFFCIKRCLNFLESSLINRNYVLGIGEFYNFFRKSIKFFKYFTVLNFVKLPHGFLTNFKQYFQPNKLIRMYPTNKKIKQDIPHFKNIQKLRLKKKKVKFFLIKNVDNRFVELQRKKKKWNGGTRLRGILTPPSIGVLFDISKSYWALNELKLIKMPIIGLIYPKTELNSRLIQYPIPILHGFDFDFKDWAAHRKLLAPNAKLVLHFKENLIDLFFLFLFILISFHSYKKLILKFINKSVIFFQNNNIINHSVVFDTYSNKNFNLSKKFYKKSFLRFYIKLWSKVKINANLFFNKKNVRFLDRSLLWKPKKNEWYLKKFTRRPGKKVKSHVFIFRNIYINRPTFWIQKKNVWNFKGLGMLRKFKLKHWFNVPFLHTILRRNLIASPAGRSSFYRLRRWNRKRFEIGFKEKTDLMPFFYKVLRKAKFKRLKRKRRALSFKYTLNDYIFQNKYIKYRQLYVFKKKKNFRYLYKFNKPLYFNRRFFLSQISTKKFKTNTLRRTVRNILSENLTRKHRFLAYLKTKVRINRGKAIKRSFLNYYSSRFWWFYKLPLVTFSILNKHNATLGDNKFYVKYYNEFIHDYTFKFFNLKFNIGRRKSFYLVNHDTKFLKRFLKKIKTVRKSRFKFLNRKALLLKRLRYRKKQKQKYLPHFNKKKKLRGKNRFQDRFSVKRKSAKISLKFSKKFAKLSLKKIKHRFAQLSRFKLRDALLKYRWINVYLRAFEKAQPLPFDMYDHAFDKFFSRLKKQRKIWDLKDLKKPLLKRIFFQFYFRRLYRGHTDDFTSSILRYISQQSMSLFSIKMSKYLRRSRVYRRQLRYRYRSRKARRVKFILRNTKEFRINYRFILKRRKYKKKKIFFLFLKKNRKKRKKTKNMINSFRKYRSRFNYLYNICPKDLTKGMPTRKITTKKITTKKITTKKITKNMKNLPRIKNITENVAKTKPLTRARYRRSKTNGNIFFFKQYMHKIVYKFLKLKNFKNFNNIIRFSYVRKQQRMMKLFSPKSMLRFFFRKNKKVLIKKKNKKVLIKKKNKKVLIKKKNKKIIIKKLYKFFLFPVSRLFIFPKLKKYVFLSKKRRWRFFRRSFRRIKWLKNLRILSKIFAIGNLHLRIKLRSKPQYKYNFNQTINYTNKLYMATLHRNQKRKKIFFFKYSHKPLYNTKFIYNFFFNGFPYFRRYRYISQINMGLYAYKRLLFKRQKKNKLFVPLKFLKKVLRRFKKKTRNRMVILRGSHRKKKVIRQSLWKLKRYQTIKLFMVSTIFSTLLMMKSKYNEDDLRGLRLRQQKKIVPWILAKDEFWRYWLAIKRPLFRKKQSIDPKKKRKLLRFLYYRYKKFKKIPRKWFLYKQSLLQNISKIKSTRLFYRFQFIKKKNKNWFFSQKRLNRHKLKQYLLRKQKRDLLRKKRAIFIKLKKKKLSILKNKKKSILKNKKSILKNKKSILKNKKKSILKNKKTSILRNKKAILIKKRKISKLFYSLEPKVMWKFDKKCRRIFFIRRLKQKQLKILKDKKRAVLLRFNFLKFVKLHLKFGEKSLVRIKKQLKIRTLLHQKLGSLINRKRLLNTLIIKQYKKNKNKLGTLNMAHNKLLCYIGRLKFKKNLPFLFMRKYVFKKRTLKRRKLRRYLKRFYIRFYRYYKYSRYRKRYKLPLKKLKKLRVMHYRRLFKFLFKYIYKGGFGHRGLLIKNMLSFSLKTQKFDLLFLFLSKAVKVYKRSMFHIRFRRLPYVFFFKFFRQFSYKKRSKFVVRRIINRMILIRYKYMKERYPSEWK